tara:strand:+ start:2677 stop:3279 length:603 start_codon:yes stop_codon:yes gene_type:complete
MPIQISNKELKAIETKILRENSFKSALKNIVQKEFDKIQKEFLSKFDSHPVTVEINGGALASNTSKTLGGVGNLFTYIGFDAGSTPIKSLRKLLTEYEIQYHTRGNYVSVQITIPTKEQVFVATPLPWATGRSWARGIERGLSGLGQYLVKSKRIGRSRSGYAIEVKNKVRPGRFTNVPYMSSLLNDYNKKLKELEKKRF